MKTASRFYWLLLGVSVITLITWLARFAMTTSSKTNSLTLLNSNEQRQGQSQRDPCWFITLKDQSIPYEMISKRQEREMHGYPTEIPLSEAIRIFNEEKQCVNALASYPLLTEDELIAAIVAGPDYVTSGEAWQSQKDALWKVVTRKVMPKGSLLLAITGSRIQESPLRPDGTIRAEGISIVIRLGLETYEPGQVIKPEQSFVVRRTFFRVETIR